MASEMAEQIGARIRQRREELGLNQRELADLLNEPAVGNQRISDWERGVNKPSERYMKVLARALDRDLPWFYGMEQEQGPTPDLMAGAPNGDPLARIEERLDAILDYLEALATRFEAAGPPAPGGELGRRLRAVDPTREDQEPPEIPPAEDAPPGSS